MTTLDHISISPGTAKDDGDQSPWPTQARTRIMILKTSGFRQRQNRYRIRAISQHFIPEDD